MMLELTFALPKEADAVRAAVNRVLGGGCRTADLHDDSGRAPVSTARMGELIVGALGEVGTVGAADASGAVGAARGQAC